MGVPSTPVDDAEGPLSSEESEIDVYSEEDSKVLALTRT